MPVTIYEAIPPRSGLTQPRLAAVATTTAAAVAAAAASTSVSLAPSQVRTKMVPNLLPPLAARVVSLGGSLISLPSLMLFRDFRV